MGSLITRQSPTTPFRKWLFKWWTRWHNWWSPVCWRAQGTPLRPHHQCEPISDPFIRESSRNTAPQISKLQYLPLEKSASATLMGYVLVESRPLFFLQTRKPLPEPTVPLHEELSLVLPQEKEQPRGDMLWISWSCLFRTSSRHLRTGHQSIAWCGLGLSHVQTEKNISWANHVLSLRTLD